MDKQNVFHSYTGILIDNSWDCTCYHMMNFKIIMLNKHMQFKETIYYMIKLMGNAYNSKIQNSELDSICLGFWHCGRQGRLRARIRIYRGCLWGMLKVL